MISIYQKLLAFVLLALSTSSSSLIATPQTDELDPSAASQGIAIEKPSKHRRARPAAEKKIAELKKQIAALKLRIQAGDKAGQVLEDQLADAVRHHQHSAKLDAKLAEARALAEHEHLRAESISAEVLEQVEAQKAIGRELQKMIADAKRERQELLARGKDQAMTELESKKRLLEENEKLARSLKEAWTRTKIIEEEREGFREAMKTIAEQSAELKKLEPLIQLKGSLEERLTELKRVEQSLLDQAKKNQLQATAQVELEAKLKTAHALQQRLAGTVKSLVAKNSNLEEKVVAQRAEALRERILRKRIETQLEDMAAERVEPPATAPAAVENESPEPAALTAAENAIATAAEASLLDIAPIYFGKNQADSEAQERSLLAQVAKIHQRFPKARFSISGHTCTDGSATGNLALSERRARRIADLMKNNGIPATAIAGVIGKGETSPNADNNTQQGREANRRVEIKVLRE